MSRKIKAILLYAVLWLSYYQIVDIIREPNKESMIKLAWALGAGILFAYVMGFNTSLFHMINKVKQQKSE